MHCYTDPRPIVIVMALAWSGCHADHGQVVDAARPVATAPARTAAPPVQPRTCAGPDALDVLFIGNSYLNLHNLPLRLSQMGKDVGVRIDVDKVTMGGENFEYHLARAKTAAKLDAQPWDVVVLQSHSLHALRDAAGFFESGAALGAKVRARGAEPLLFETWARRAGHNLYGYFKPAGGNPAAMQAEVTAQYAALADAEAMRVAPVGTAWLRVTREHPEIDLFAKDGGHPSAAGAYLGACVVFCVLTERAPQPGTQASAGVDPEIAATLRRIATEVVRPPCGAEAPAEPR